MQNKQAIAIIFGITGQDGFVSEYKTLVSNLKVMLDMGWKPKFSFYQLADMMIEHK